MRWRDAVLDSAPVRNIHAWGNVKKGRRVGTFKRLPTMAPYPIAGTPLRVPHTGARYRKWKAAK